MDMAQEVEIVHDLEASGLLNKSTVDYTTSPWKLKSSFKMHVVSVLEVETNTLIAFYDGPKIILDGRNHKEVIEGTEYILENYTPLEYKHYPLNKFPDYVKKRKIKKATAHNGINFDLLAYKVYFGLEYTINEDGLDTWAGKPCYHNDTLVKSKTLNPDRHGGHSLEVLAKSAGEDQKVEFRKHIPISERFNHFAADMLYYNLFDLKSNYAVDKYLDKEAGKHDWKSAITLEKCVADMITRQSHRGFAFNMQLAEKNIQELDKLMQERRERVEPVLPMKKATKKIMNDFTPPKSQFKKNGEMSAHMEKFIAKIGATKTEKGILFEGNEYDLPLEADKPLVTKVKASIDDTTHIKEWLVSLGWNPSEWKEKDITVDARKQKLSFDKYKETVRRYVEQTLESAFCKERCDTLGCFPSSLEKNLLNKKLDRPIRVKTNPSFTRGQDKEMCPDLDRISEQFPFAKDVVEYLTYKHRRNSILGGGLEWEEGEEADKGYIAAVREDGRIPTPADTCGAATSRMKHKLVANIPRIASLYGEPMRELFGADEDYCYQIGYDFASLEARIEAHYCFKYETPTEQGVKEYCESLLLEKPHDVHCYSEDTEILTKEGWKLFGDIEEGEEVAQWENGVISFVIPETIVWQDYKGIMVEIKNAKISQLITPNHRVLLEDRGKFRVKLAEDLLNLKSQYNIITSGKFDCKDSLFIRLAVAVQSDGHLNKDSSAITFSFTKQRKINRLEKLLKDLNQEYKVSIYFRKGRNETKIRIPACDLTRNLRIFLGEQKELTTESCIPYAANVVDEIQFWDGTVKNNGDIVLDTTCKKTRDTIQVCGILSGFKAHINEYERNTTFGKTYIYRVYLSKNSKGTSIKCSKDVKLINYSGKIGCVAVPSSFVVTRKEGIVSISGNTMMAKRISEILETEFARGPAKNVKYGCTYGAQAAKVAKTIGSSLEVGETVFEAFWNAALPLKLLKEALQNHWKANDKKFIITIDGRKVPTRSAHAILNSLFQSAGVICAKKSMVRWESKMREEGLLVDFWTEDWHNKQWGQQMIAYHDEAQIEVTKGLMKFKKFPTKEECNKFRDWQKNTHGFIWSEPHESPKGGWFVAYSRVGELVVEAVNETSAFYKLNVPLSADYVVGKSWAQCH